jgi:hypothetical protein
MATAKLDRVSLVHPMGDMGDRQIQGISTFIAGSEWQMETDFHRGTIGDVSVYRNMSFPNAGDPNWQWYAGIPTANIKTYRLAGVLPEMTAHEPQEENPTAPSGSSGKATHGSRAGGRDVELDVPGPGPGQVRA